MGMDVSGKNPTSEAGVYFRNNVWWWHPLWSYCEKVAPELAAKVEYGHSNDGSGLEAEDAVALADVLDREIASGATAEYAKQYAQAMSGSDVVDEPSGYPFDVENVREFSAFVRASGGFEIW